MSQTIQMKSNDRYFVTGSTGSGKTVWGKNVLLPQFNRIIFHDFKLENLDLLSKGFILVNTPDQMLAQMGGGNFKILYQGYSC